MLLPSLLKSGDQVYQKVIKQLYQKMLLLNLLITIIIKSCYLESLLNYLTKLQWYEKKSSDPISGPFKEV